MIQLLAVVGALALAVLHTTWLWRVSPLFTLVGIAVYVDVRIAALSAFALGFTLDALEVHLLGFSSTAVCLIAVGIVELARLSIRSFVERPAWLYFMAVALFAALAPLGYGIPLEAAAWNEFFARIILHLLLALLFLPVFRGLGERYRARLRERGIL